MKKNCLFLCFTKFSDLHICLYFLYPTCCLKSSNQRGGRMDKTFGFNARRSGVRISGRDKCSLRAIAVNARIKNERYIFSEKNSSSEVEYNFKIFFAANLIYYKLSSINTQFDLIWIYLFRFKSSEQFYRNIDDFLDRFFRLAVRSSFVFANIYCAWLKYITWFILANGSCCLQKQMKIKFNVDMVYWSCNQVIPRACCVIS